MELEMLKAYTDYPAPNKGYDGILRPVVIVDFDHDKYVTTSTGESFKAGYVYRSRRKRPFRYKTLVRHFPK